MTAPLKLTIGRERVTKVVGPGEAAYIKQINGQVRQVVNNLEQVVNYVEGVTGEAIKFGLEPAFAESQRLVPVDTGKLKRSGFIETRRTASGTQAAMGYGRYGSPRYAGIVHENLMFRHAPPTQAKFLEAAVMMHIDNFRRRVVLFLQQKTGVQKNG